MIKIVCIYVQLIVEFSWNPFKWHSFIIIFAFDLWPKSVVMKHKFSTIVLLFWALNHWMGICIQFSDAMHTSNTWGTQNWCYLRWKSDQRTCALSATTPQALRSFPSIATDYRFQCSYHSNYRWRPLMADKSAIIYRQISVIKSTKAFQWSAIDSDSDVDQWVRRSQRQFANRWHTHSIMQITIGVSGVPKKIPYWLWSLYRLFHNLK